MPSLGHSHLVGGVRLAATPCFRFDSQALASSIADPPKNMTGMKATTYEVTFASPSPAPNVSQPRAKANEGARHPALAADAEAGNVDDESADESALVCCCCSTTTVALLPLCC